MSTGRPPLTWWTALMRGMLRHVLRWYEQDVAMTQSDGVISAEPRELAQLSTDALRAFRDRERARYEAIKTRATPSGARQARDRTGCACRPIADRRHCVGAMLGRRRQRLPELLRQPARPDRSPPLVCADARCATRTGPGRQQFEPGADARRGGLCPPDRGARRRRALARSAPSDPVSVSFAWLRPPFPDLRAIRDRDDPGAADRGRPGHG